MLKLAKYLKARLCEKSTWAAVVIAVTGGAALDAPYSYLAIGAGVIGALVPSDLGKAGEG